LIESDEFALEFAFRDETALQLVAMPRCDGKNAVLLTVGDALIEVRAQQASTQKNAKPHRPSCRAGETLEPERTRASWRKAVVHTVEHYGIAGITSGFLKVATHVRILLHNLKQAMASCRRREWPIHVVSFRIVAQLR
jgi:hypothetical protein